MVFDCFQFFNELNLLELRLNTLDPVVDFFVITESTVTFSGELKPLYYLENKNLFSKFHHKIIHIVVDDTPNDGSVSAFDRDAYQKTARSRGLKNCSKNDVIIYSDLDEIPNPEKIRKIIDHFDDEKVYHFAQRQFYFYINLEEVSGKLLSYAGDFDDVKTKQWLGSYMFKFGLLDRFSMHEIRINKTKDHAERVADGGWHFTYMGGDKTEGVVERVSHKIKSAAHQEFNNRKILSNLEKKISAKKDIFGRSSNFKKVNIDDSYPDYLIKNLELFNHLVLKEKDSFFSWIK